MVEPGNRLGANTYQAVLRGTNFGSWILQRLWGYGTALLLWQTPFLRRVEVGGQGSHMPASFALQNRLLNFLTLPRDFWVTFILHCLTHAVAANEHLSLDAVIQHAVSDRDRDEAERLQECGEMCLMWLRWQCGLCETCLPCCSYTTDLFLMLFFFFNKLIVHLSRHKSPPACPLDRDGDFCHNAGGWL